MLNCILDLQILNKYIHRTNTPPPSPSKKGGPVHFFFIMKKSIGRKYRYKFTRKGGGGVQGLNRCLLVVFLQKLLAIITF